MIYRLDAACISHTGRIRRSNEDNFCFDRTYLEQVHGTMAQPINSRRLILNSWISAVFDGMGGENFGELASFAAAGAMAAIPTSRSIHRPLEEYLRELAEMLNDSVLHAQQQMHTTRMGTTMVSLLLHRGYAYFCNLGDSRSYRLRDGILTQLSKDHASAALARPGCKAPLTQHLGIDPEDMVIEPHIVAEKYRRDDWYLLCSDGLSDMVPDEEIAQILYASKCATECVQMLTSSALDHGGRDNITIIAVRIY